MRKVFLFTMMCLFGLFGSMYAQTNVEVNVGTDKTVAVCNQLPIYPYYEYSVSQQIYTAEEMMELAGTISSIAFRQANDTGVTRTVSVYLANIDDSSFSNNNDWCSLDESNLVFSGEVTTPAISGEWMTIEFQTPFEYAGGNLLVCLYDHTGSYLPSGMYPTFDSFQNNERHTLQMHRDGTPYNIASLSGVGTLHYYKNIVRFNITIEGEFKNITIKPSPIDLGARPNGAWMAPEEVKIATRTNDFVVNAIESTNSYFQLSDVEYPVTVSTTEPLFVNVTHTEAEGDVTGQLSISYGEEGDTEFVDITAFAYNPISNDVYETAEEITSYPFSTTPDLTTIYDNYSLPGDAEDGKDVVYELNFNNDVVLTADVVGDNGKVAVYAEDFGGKEGPMADNNYTGVQVGSAMRSDTINGLMLPAGKYYLAASSTSEFTLNVNAETIPVPEKPYNPIPYSGEQGITEPSLSWTFGNYTVEYQLLFGTTNPPQEVYVDWTSNLEIEHFIEDLPHNRNYFWQVNTRNTTGTTYGDVWSFTSVLDIPQDMNVSNRYIYEGENIEITWTGIDEGSLLGYNIYVNGEIYNDAIIIETSYVIENLTYNMDGYAITVTAVYEEGESAQSEATYVYVTGMTDIAGNIYEQDSVTPVGEGSVTINGTDELGNPASYIFQADENGAFTGEILAGNYIATALVDNYQNAEVFFTANYGVTAIVNFSMYEVYYPVKYITATEVDSTQAVNVVWSMQGSISEDFETGDFSVNEWNNNESSNPWVITENAYEGDYAMKSACEEQDHGLSAIEITVEVPYDGLVSFYHKISSEQEYDLGNFYIDGVLMSSVSGEMDWTYRELVVSEGTHTYRWEYSKDIMWQEGDDAYFVDNITFYQEPESFAGSVVFTTEKSKKEFKGGVSTGIAKAKNEMATRALSSYNLYKKNILTNEIELLLEKTNDTAYVDYAWATDEPGSYQWGASAVYAGNRGTEVIFSENFEGGVMPTGWTTYFSAPDWYQEYYGKPSEWYVGQLLDTDYDFDYSAGSGSYSAFSSSVPAQGYLYGTQSCLITPAISVKPNSMLSFLYTNPAWSTDFSYLNVYVAESAQGPWTNLVWSTDGSYTETNTHDWYEIQVDLADYANTVVYLVFEHIANPNSWYGYAGFGVGLDNITIAAESPESEIKWSKPIDKDMTTSVTVYAMTDNGDPVDGTVVSFVNLTEEGINYEATLDETGFVTIEDFRKGTYELNISKDGYYSSVENEVVEILEATDFDVFLTEILAAVEDLYVSPTGWAMWKSKNDRALESYTVMLDGYIEAEGLTVPYYQHENLIDSAEYTTTIIANYTMGESEEMSYTWVKASEDIFSPVTDLAAEYADEEVVVSWTFPDDDEQGTSVKFDFEDGTLNGWTTIDADGDGFNWVSSIDLLGEGVGNNGSIAGATSQSYDFHAGALNPDNYLVTAEKYAVGGASQLKFWACAQDMEYQAEHFGVAISTAGNTSAADFTTIAEWTVGGKSANASSTRGTKEQTTWLEYTVDLSAYSGQEVYIAFRHFNCSDMFYFNIDDIEITTGSKETRDGTWAYYDDGNYVDGIGGPSTFSWAIKLRADDIAGLGALTKVAAYDRLSTSGTFDICLGGDNEPGASVHNQGYIFSGANDFVEINLTKAIHPNGQNVWIVFNTNDGISYPAAQCANTGDADSRWIYLENNGWFDVLEGAGLEATWMIRGYFEEIEESEEPLPAIAEILGVMIYKNGELLNSTPITGYSYTDVNGQVGDEYCVKVVYGGELDYTYYAMSEAECVVAVLSDITQSTALASGWNWYSSYIDVEGAEGLELMKEALGTSATQIKNQTAFVDYTSIWFGTLTATNLEEMYMIKMNEALNMEITGLEANPTDHPITLGTNWKWIGYPVNGTMSVNEAFSNITPNNGDYVKSQVGFAQYYEGLGWTGTLNTMVPGQGYMYQNTSGTAKTLVYPEANAKSELDANITSENNHWVPNSTKYPTNMTMIATVEGMKDYEVAAFCNGEVRGSARPIYVEELDSYMIFLTIYGEENDEISFRYFDLITEEEIGIVNVVNYGIDATFGNIMNPYVLNFATLNIDEMSSNLSIYPNPVEKGGKVYFGTTCEKVEIYNTLGVKISEYENVNSIEGIETSGVYVVKAISNGNVSYSRVIVE